MRYRIATDYTHLTKEEGKELEEKRKNVALSIKEVAERVWLNPSTLSVLEKKGGRISEAIRDKLIKCYNNP
tara:strand:- start:333 stop:545 length:213 start_codon:yes stop_codon:yes gene_type:complete